MNDISQTSNQMTDKEIEQQKILDRIEQGKEEILMDIALGRVPKTVSDFADLHDYVDANVYGGLCDSETWKSIVAAEDSGNDELADELREGLFRVGGAVQSALGQWLKDGRI